MTHRSSSAGAERGRDILGEAGTARQGRRRLRGPIATLLATAALVVACGDARPAGPRAPRAPVVVVVFDALDAGHVGHLGYERDITPHLDRLAEEGASSTSAPCDTRWTRLSRDMNHCARHMKSATRRPFNSSPARNQSTFH